jgi:hypothetical protein
VRYDTCLSFFLSFFLFPGKSSIRSDFKC